MAKVIHADGITGEILTSAGLLTFDRGEADVSDELAEELHGIGYSFLRVRLGDGAAAKAKAEEEAKAKAEEEAKAKAEEEAKAKAEEEAKAKTEEQKTPAKAPVKAPVKPKK